MANPFNRNPSFLIMLKLLLLLLFLFFLPLTTAQTGSPAPPRDPLADVPKFNPSMAIIMIALISAFFFMGFFSVYVRQCAERRYRGGHFNPAAIGGGGWRIQAGLDAEVIEAYFPTFLYSAVKGLKIGKGSLECAICLNEFEDDETLRLIPKCSHVFHPSCIDAWLASHTTCPVCRANLIPTPADLTLDSVHMFEPDHQSVEAGERSDSNNDAQSHVAIHVGQENEQIREVPQEQSPNANLLNPTLRSRSTGWLFNKLFSKSTSAGSSLGQAGENYERFTLRLSEEARNQLWNTHLTRTKSCATFSRVRSSRKGYRSHSLGAGKSKNYFQYERFYQEESGSTASQNAIPANNTSVRSVRASKAPVDSLSDKNHNNSDNYRGERSMDRLMPDSESSVGVMRGFHDQK